MKWQITPVFLPGESHGQRSLGGCSPWGYNSQTRLTDKTTTTTTTTTCLLTAVMAVVTFPPQCDTVSHNDGHQAIRRQASCRFPPSR